MAKQTGPIPTTDALLIEVGPGVKCCEIGYRDEDGVYRQLRLRLDESPEKQSTSWVILGYQMAQVSEQFE